MCTIVFWHYAKEGVVVVNVELRRHSFAQLNMDYIYARTQLFRVLHSVNSI